MMKMAELDTSVMQEFFQEELDMIKSEIQASDELFNELKEHFDKVKKSTSSGALTFISKQTPSLISAKNNKISLMKDLVNTKKIIIETSLKTKSEEGKDGDNATIAAIHKMLLENKKDDYIKNMVTEESQEQYDDEYYDNLLEAKIEEINEEAETKEEEIKTAGNIENVKFVVDMEKNIYAVDENYNILEDVEIPPFIIEFIEENGEIVRAENQYGEELDIVSLEE